MLQRRLRLLGLSESEIEAVLEETLIRVLARARDADAELLPVAMYGTAVRVADARRNGGHGLHEAEPAVGERTISAREIAALGQVPFRQRVALVGVEVAGYSVEDVAEALGVAPDEALALLRDGRSALARLLQEHGEE